ncbi:MAG: LAGLIDADG family homing endonuclease [archaeon]
MNNTTEKIDLKEFIPDMINCGRYGKQYQIKPIVTETEKFYTITYYTDIHNQFGVTRACRKYSANIQKYISRSNRTFEVLGLLQGEMSKTYNKTIIFCNCEPNLNREVMDWYNDELNIKHGDWHWYIKVNVNKPADENYKKFVEDKVINYWLKETKVAFDMRYPTTVSYIKNTLHTELKERDYGSLIIEFKSSIISEVFKNFVKKITYEHILKSSFDEIKAYMRGIIAAESCVEINKPIMKYRVHISASNPDEKLIFHKCLERLGVESKIYGRDKLIVSKRHNNFKLLDLNLMSLNPTKFKKFAELISCYYPGESKMMIVKEEEPIYTNILSIPQSLYTFSV